MSTEPGIVLAKDDALAVPLEQLAGAAQAFADRARADNTMRAYEGDWRRFVGFAQAAGVSALPAAPETVGLYLTHLAVEGRRTATVDRALAAIAFVHRREGFPFDRAHPAIRDVLAGIHRELGRAPVKKRPVEDTLLRRLVDATAGERWVALRDRALLLVGWFSACRRSEIAAFQVADVVFVEEGCRITIRRSKTDQEGRGREIGLPYAGAPELCPVRTLRSYLDALQLADGPLFRDVRAGVVRGGLSPAAVRAIVQRLCRRAGVPAREYGAHSLRSGFITTAAKRGKPLEAIMRQSGHRSERVARGYITHATVFVDNPAAGLL